MTTLPSHAWRDGLSVVSFNGRRLVGASFRGVPFFVEESDRAGGRRLVTHKFPFRNDPFVEDVGREARDFKITGYVIGDDYLTQRDRLLSALEDDDSGPGTLVHPYYGIKRAMCGPMSVRESRAEGGMATFTMAFTETPLQAPVPITVADPIGKVAASATAARAATKLELAEKFDPVGLPGFALASAETALKSATGGLASALGPVAATTQELATLNSQAKLVTAQAAALVRAPATILDSFGGAIAALVTTAIAAPGAMLAALTDAYNTVLGVPVQVLTATRVREAANLAALSGALRRVIAIEAARLAPTVPYASIEDATAARDQVAAQLEEQALGAGDTAYPALVTLRSDLLRSVPGADVFPRIITVTRRTAIPSLLLTYQLYGSVDLELDVIARNRVAARHPGFVVGDLRVLSAVG
ncbi:MAG: DNA circularization N-terminal domain-containing protein [Actinomycetota bacterium]